MQLVSSARTRMSRRDAIRFGAAGGFGIAGALKAGDSVADAWWPQRTGTPSGKYPPIPTWKTELKQLTPNAYAYIQAGGPGMDNAGVSNAGLIVGPDNMMAIDALAAPIHTKAFMAAARQATGKDFGRLVNTHHHGDHTAGNCFFLPAEIVSHPYCREMVIKQGVPSLRTRPASWQVGADELKLAAPMSTFDDRMTYHYGNTVVELMSSAPAHTYGDVMLYLPQHKLLFAGDIAFFYIAPVNAGHVSKWIEAIEKIQEMDVDTIVPGHGPIGTKKDLAELGAYLSLLKREARLRFDTRMSPGKAAADIDMNRFSTWPNPERIVGSVVRLYAEFDGTIGPDLSNDVMRKATDEYNALKGKPASNDDETDH